jgi:diguanylate cyclase (GGDEF)-like protein
MSDDQTVSWVLCRLDAEGTVTAVDGPADEILGVDVLAVGRPVTDLVADGSPLADLVAGWPELAGAPRGTRRPRVEQAGRPVPATVTHRPVAGGAEILLVLDPVANGFAGARRARGRALPGALRCDLSILTAAVAEALTDDPETVLVTVVNLDRFAVVNERYGLAAGTAVLDAVGERLRAVLRPVDLLCRTVGDEFVIACRDVGDGGAPAISRRVNEILAEPVALADGRWTPAASLGAVRPTGGETAEQLIDRARHAMAMAKRERRTDTAT